MEDLSRKKVFKKLLWVALGSGILFSLAFFIVFHSCAYLGRSEDSYKIFLRKGQENRCLSLVTKVKNLIYREATIHNPAGDLLPDSLDDIMKSKLKSVVEK